ncbi:carbohydrate kinase family protein [Neogemmobacter tilapiae]|uniref:carbohydrate kinase family protein n=1 Tax=Neogemmobacter tilapiae TaxID=875041 RepID=UPI001671E119|nr:carbohydrate kinase family protein [Gemmobacter tilapiae]
MKTLDVAGGLYGENCRFPKVEEILGSGGRAAIALADAGQEIRWHYYCPPHLQQEARTIMATPRITHFAYSSNDQIHFSYMHPLSRPIYSPGKISISPPITINAAFVLRFGMMEGDAIVTANSCVYDPQSLDPIPFEANGSHADRLAVVLNQEEVLSYSRAPDEEQAVKRIAARSNVSVILVKSGADGCRVYENGKLTATVPAYRSDRVYKIGTGDIFTAAFSGAWLCDGRRPADAADHASRCVSRYAETRHVSTSETSSQGNFLPAPIGTTGAVLVLGSTSSMPCAWLFHEARDALRRMGVTISPRTGTSSMERGDPFVSTASKASISPTAVLALLDQLDTATMLWIFDAFRSKLPIVGYSQGSPSIAHSLSTFPEMEICDDFSTAIYHVAWAARS